MMRWFEEFKNRKSAREKFLDFFAKLTSKRGSYTLPVEPVADGEAAVYLNVYDMFPRLNRVISRVGIGVFHVGVEIYGHEYSFHGVEPNETTGIYEVAPKKAGTVMKFKESIYLGNTTLDQNQVIQLVREMETEYIEKRYHLLRKNCATFCKDLAQKLCNRKIPKKINRLARLARGSKIIETIFDPEDFMP